MVYIFLFYSNYIFWPFVPAHTFTYLVSRMSVLQFPLLYPSLNHPSLPCLCAAPLSPPCRHSAGPVSLTPLILQSGFLRIMINRKRAFHRGVRVRKCVQVLRALRVAAVSRIRFYVLFFLVFCMICLSSTLYAQRAQAY